jgi:adenosylmethionine-8-amino-7-oxononanoate aminotransferase
MHGPTFMGNPLACAVANTSLKLIEQGDWQRQVTQIEAIFAQHLPKLNQYSRVKAVRWLGAIGVVEVHNPVKMDAIQAFFVAHGVWIRPFGKLIYMMPPFITSRDDLVCLINVVEVALQQDELFA